MHDAIELEKLGVPAAVICTDAFIATAEAQATICGAPGYAFVVVSHPVGSLALADLEQRAEAALPHVVAILTQGDTPG